MKALILCCVCFFSTQAIADTFLWKVSKGESVLYLGGTVHVLSKQDLPFPAAFDRAFAAADLVAFETDISQLENPSLQFKLMGLMSYQDGRLLNQVISAGLYQQLNDFLTSRGMPPHLLLSMKPAGVMITMLGIELQRLGITESGADVYYFNKARDANKPVLGLESIDTHINYLGALGEGNEEAFLQQTLNDIEKTESLMQTLVSAWKTGDVAGIEKHAVDDMRNSFPQVYERLLVTRNIQWMQRLRQLLQTPETELVLVGAAHLVGPDGLLFFLTQEGYSIEQL